VRREEADIGSEERRLDVHAREVSMEGDTKLSRQKLLKVAGTAGAGIALGGLGSTAKAGVYRRVGPGGTTKISIGVGSWARDSMTKVLKDLQFTKKTGIEVEVKVRPGDPNGMITQMTGAIQADTTPYDVIDFEDEVATTFSRARWLLPLNDVVNRRFWADWPKPMIDLTNLWDRHQGELFRIHHNYEACYWWYRKDWFDAKGVDVPKTWDDVAKLGAVFTDRGKKVYASEDGLKTGTAFFQVYLAWLTRQAGGQPFGVGPKYQEALEYAHDLLYRHRVLNPASLQKDYDAQNADYTADRVAFMRQWPYFYDVVRANKKWFKPEKAVVTFPPAGPGGKQVSTYAAGWGFGIPKTTENEKAAKELVQFLVATENAGKMAQIDTWYLSARTSVLKAVGNKGMAKHLREYSKAGIITTRPYHPKFVQAWDAISRPAAAFLTNQIKIEEAMKRAQRAIKRV
jgi:multiple sugar transport system substrate-binding protein